MYRLFLAWQCFIYPPLPYLDRHRAIVDHNAQHATMEKAYQKLKEAGVYYSGTYRGWYHGWERDGLQTDMTEVKHVHVILLACTSLLLVL